MRVHQVINLRRADPLLSCLLDSSRGICSKTFRKNWLSYWQWMFRTKFCAYFLEFSTEKTVAIGRKFSWQWLQQWTVIYAFTLELFNHVGQCKIVRATKVTVSVLAMGWLWLMMSQLMSFCLCQQMYIEMNGCRRTEASYRGPTCYH